MSDYQPGDLVRIVIENARVTEIVRHGDGNGDDLRFTYEAKDGEQDHSSVWAQAPGVFVERVAPAEWPPHEGDLWQDNSGITWFAVRAPAGIRLMNSTRAIYLADKVNETFGPLTLVRREEAGA